MKKKYTRKDILERLEKLGASNIELTYRKGEGWWLVCDISSNNHWDGWLSMDSEGAVINLENIFDLNK